MKAILPARHVEWMTMVDRALLDFLIKPRPEFNHGQYQLNNH
jgi:hypothetical protein